MVAFCVAFLCGYLCGSIPFGLILTRCAGTVDLRKIGSGNVGATNVLRTGRKDLAALTLLADAAKGALPTLIALHVGVATDQPFLGIAATLGAFIGHIFPIWLKFKGGKGVATFIGCLFALHWPTGLIFIVIWLSVAFLLRYSSAAALLASAVTPVALKVFERDDLAITFFILAVLLWIMHRANIVRLATGQETKIKL